MHLPTSSGISLAILWWRTVSSLIWYTPVTYKSKKQQLNCVTVRETNNSMYYKDKYRYHNTDRNNYRSYYLFCMHISIKDFWRVRYVYIACSYNINRWQTMSANTILSYITNKLSKSSNFYNTYANTVLGTEHSIFLKFIFKF